MPAPRTVSLEAAQASGQFTRLADVTDIAIDLRYASANNFVGRDVYSPMDCAWLHARAAHAVAKAQQQVASSLPGHRIVVFDALRPHRIQIALWNALLGTGLEKYLADPAMGSIHSYGFAVDAGILTPSGHELDMGTGFDAMQDESHPEFEAQMLRSGRLSAQHIANRLVLREAMLQAGFSGISTEWWHFDFGDKKRIRFDEVRVD
jgi:D-alanyl-D-alanine dipeptidase